MTEPQTQTPGQPSPEPSPPAAQSAEAAQRLWGRIFTAEDFGRFIAEIRFQRDLTQAELAAELGISRQYLSGIESGHPTLYSDRLFTLLNVLQISLIAEANTPPAQHSLIGGRETPSARARPPR